MAIRTLLFQVLLIACMGPAFAQPTTQWSANANTAWYNAQDSQFIITAPAQLAGLSVLVAAGNDFTGKTIQVGNDLDLSAHLWTPIGVNFNIPFSGTFNGNEHTISGLFAVKPNDLFVGLFGLCRTSTLSNIRLVDPYIRAEGDAGSLVGSLGTKSTMTDCHATGVDVVTTSSNTGGLVGDLINTGSMLRCSSQGAVTGVNQVGGLVGSPYSLTTITECWSAGTVNASYLAGGLVGYCTFAFGPGLENTVNNCYSRANVTVVNGRAGGLYGGTDGNLIVRNSYATGTATGAELIGGLIGAAAGMSITNAYWDTGSSGLADGIGGWLGTPTAQDITGKTTAEMRTTAMVALLNATQTPMPWTIDPDLNDGYPILASMSVGLPKVPTRVELSVFPTVFNDSVQIVAKSELSSYALYNSNAALVRSASLKGTQARIDLSDLASGTYLLVVRTVHGNASQWVEKQ